MSESSTSTQGKTYPPDEELAKSANARPEMKDQDLEEFWDQQAKDKISWFEPYDTVLEWNIPYAKWFVGGKLNACYNCVDRHVENGKGDKVALHVVPDDGPDSSEARDITFSQLQEQVVNRATEELRLAQERFRFGVASSVEVTDAQTSLALAEQGRIDAIYIYHKSLAALEALVGRPLR